MHCMSRWLLKSIIHRAISLLPGSRQLNEIFQERVTKSLGLSAGLFESVIGRTRMHWEDLLAVRPGHTGTFTAVELGTGWYPIVPVALFLCGASKIWTYDIEPLLSPERMGRMLRFFCDYAERGDLEKMLPAVRAERFSALRDALACADRESPQQVLERLGIHAINGDARKSGLPAGSVDFFFSTSVLEYVPKNVMAGLFAEYLRLASPAAAMSHFINLKDQFWNFDKSITPFNNLKYPARVWRWLDSPLIPQTRLRVSDYRAALHDAGFEIVREITTSGDAADLDSIRLAPEFERYTKPDLLMLTAWFAARPRGT